MLACFVATVIWSLFETCFIQFIQIFDIPNWILIGYNLRQSISRIKCTKIITTLSSRILKKHQSLFSKKTLQNNKNGILLKKWNLAHWNEDSLFRVRLQMVPDSIFTWDNFLLNLCALNYISNTKITTIANFVHSRKTQNMRKLTWMLRPRVGMFSFDKFCEKKSHKMKNHLRISTSIFLFIT